MIFRKDSRVHKTVQFDQVDASTGAADSSPGSLQISEDQEQSKNADTKRKFGPGNVHVSTPVSKEQPKPNFDLQEEQEDDKFETQAPTESGPTKDGSGRPAFLSKFKSPNLVIPGRGHRRNRSLDVKFSNLLTTNVDTRENEYDIISDSELPSSFDRGSDEYLVVDGLTGQKVGSFTPTAGKETFEDHDMLYYLRLGLFEVLQTILTLLPDNMVTRVFGTILKVEHLLVLVNQENEKLREVAVQVSLLLNSGSRNK